MPQVPLGVTYGGPALDAGEMPVRELAPALLAIGELFAEASLLAHPDREPVSVKVRATSHGSFVCELAIHSPDTWNQILSLLTSRPVTALVDLQALLFGTGGLFWLILKIKNAVIERKEALPSGMIRLTLDDGTVIEGKADAVALYERQSARQSAEEIVSPLKQEGIETVDFAPAQQPVVTVNQSDLASFASTADENVLNDREVEMIVTVETVSFASGYKWRFSEGDITFTATIDDPAFRARIDAGEAFRKEDMLRARMRVVQSQLGNKLKTERTVVRVIEHYPRQEQTSFGVTGE